MLSNAVSMIVSNSAMVLRCSIQELLLFKTDLFLVIYKQIHLKNNKIKLGTAKSLLTMQFCFDNFLGGIVSTF